MAAVEPLAGADPRRLVLLRHGRTAWNAEHRIQGQSDVELDEAGHDQARAVAPSIAKMAPRVLWSSDLLRARQTADYLASEIGLQPSYDRRLREYALGELQGLTHDECAARDPDAYARFRAGEWDDIPGGETSLEVAGRTSAALLELAASLAPGETGVAVGHGASIRTAAVALVGWPLTAAADLRPLTNCAWLELLERPGGGWSLKAYNKTA